MTARGGLMVYRRRCGDVDAIDEYCQRLAGGLRHAGIPATYEAGGTGPARPRARAQSWLLVHYNPFGWGRWGVAPRLLRDVAVMARRERVPTALMVHEAYVDMEDWRTTLMGAYQRMQLHALTANVRAVMTTTQALARQLGPRAVHVPVASTITPAGLSRSQAREQLGPVRELVVALFGRANPARSLGDADAAIRRVAAVHGAHRLTVLNLGAGAPELSLPAEIDVRTPGCLDPDALSAAIAASDLVLLPFTDGLSTRRTTLMTALAHGRPVLGLRGHNTDAILARHTDAVAMTPVGDGPAYARAAVALLADRAALAALGDAGRELYAREFDWPIVARRVGVILAEIAA